MSKNRAYHVIELGPLAYTDGDPYDVVRIIPVSDNSARGLMDVYSKVTLSDGAAGTSATVAVHGAFISNPEDGDVFEVVSAQDAGDGTATVATATGKDNKYSHLRLTASATVAENESIDSLRVYVVTY